MKLRTPFLIILAVIIADQALKVWIKTHYMLHQSTHLFGADWAQLYFVENEGMAWGMAFGGAWGKMLLTLFRLGAVIFGTWYIKRIVREKYTRGFIICAALIYAGALGNLLDSMFYGMIFNESTGQVAQFLPKGGGYAGFLHGKVVDMFYFPMFRGNWPTWVPFVGGSDFLFFSAIFNIADAAISVGVISLILFQKRFLQREQPEQPRTEFTDTPERTESSEVV
ncbi:MAG: lipoprotein signal peptidase [Chitinophagaceae bacterium]|nr:MAG: lipoprotein signal peptidase [Chitinophagaceae bacterium]